MNPSDRRHLESMRNQLEAYGAGRLDLSGLISSLEALLGLLEEMPEAWRDAFREQWGVLEEVYSVAIVRERPVESTENSALIAPALEQLRAMIDDALRTGFV
jgi:hypothetical protein